MHTEEEARKLICPFRQADKVVEQADGTTLRHVVTDEPKCIASKCAAWRWDREPVDFRDRELVNKRTGERVNGGFSADTEWRLVNPDEPAPERTGYCGRAGKP